MSGAPSLLAALLRGGLSAWGGAAAVYLAAAVASGARPGDVAPSVVVLTGIGTALGLVPVGFLAWIAARRRWVLRWFAAPGAALLVGGPVILSAALNAPPSALLHLAAALAAGLGAWLGAFGPRRRATLAPPGR